MSKTDAKGIIRYANDVFLRVSGYTEEQVLGKPHNLIRHPDMPRCVFSLLWETIAAGRELFAYIVNLSSDGSHYWVYAHVTPSFDATGRITGYHSNRRLPDRGPLEAIRPLYAQLVREEARHATKQAAIAASTALMNDWLAARGQNYDEFVWSLTNATSGVAA